MIRAFRRPLLALIVALVFLLVAVVSYIHSNEALTQQTGSAVTRQLVQAEDVLTQRLVAYAMGECNRSNILREQLDGTDRVLHYAFLASAQVTGGSARIPRLRAIAAQFRSAAAAIRFIPVTDCAKALADPTHYQPPQPIAFGSYP